MIGRLLGHTQVETTARYAHLAQDSLRESAMRVSESIAGGFSHGQLGVRRSDLIAPVAADVAEDRPGGIPQRAGCSLPS